MVGSGQLAVFHELLSVDVRTRLGLISVFHTRLKIHGGLPLYIAQPCTLHVKQVVERHF